MTLIMRKNGTISAVTKVILRGDGTDDPVKLMNTIRARRDFARYLADPIKCFISENMYEFIYLGLERRYLYYLNTDSINEIIDHIDSYNTRLPNEIDKYIIPNLGKIICEYVMTIIKD